MTRPVILAPYSAQWPAMFRRARAELTDVFGGLARGIEHVGSTAVPGLTAKPIIDILLGAASLSDVESRIQALERPGYAYIPRFETEFPLRRYFDRQAPASPCHLHAVTIESSLWRDQLVFRDALRADPSLVAAYGALKQRLAAEFGDDVSRYTEAKGPFIRGVVAAAVRGASGKG